MDHAALNTLGLAVITFGGGAYALYQKARTDRITEAAKSRGDTITELKETITRQEAEYTALAQRKEQEIANERKQTDHYRDLFLKSEQDRAAQISKTREQMEAEEARQTQIRHELRSEMRAQSERIYQLDSENKRLRQESDHQKSMILALTERISALEVKSVNAVPVILTAQVTPTPSDPSNTTETL